MLLMGTYIGTTIMEKINSPLKKLKTELSYDSAIPLLGSYPKEKKSLSQRNNELQCSLQYYSQ